MTNFHRDTSIGNTPTPVQEVTDPAVLSAVEDVADRVTSLEDKLHSIREMQELILGQEVEEK